jgi:hypothetical protein
MMAENREADRLRAWSVPVNMRVVAESAEEAAEIVRFMLHDVLIEVVDEPDGYKGFNYNPFDVVEDVR